ncbi:MAG: mannose-1-phosphate guanylyltransferase [Lachnospiraceae bacterium]|nr:mannose-1-phosphate guanylyltransferase [Lachnospiraceae bacterium]
MKVYGVIMAGGGGTRFWPLSRHTMPKQLLNLSGKDRMINETVDRIATIADKKDIFIVTNVDQVPGMQAAVTVTGRVEPDHILAEPSARNTAACIGYAAMEIIKKYGDGIMTIFPSDHFIRDQKAFEKVLRFACEVADKEECLVTLGIAPTFPCTGYGYIKFEKAVGDDLRACRVLEFKEKPDIKKAEEYVASGDYAWNSGMFVWKASVILDQMKTLLPDVYECIEKIGDAMGTPDEKRVIGGIYPTIPSISIDYGIMEKASDVRVISADMGWSDVGSWDNLGEIYEEDEEGNVFAGDHLAIDTKGCITYSEKRLITTIGVSDLIVVETEDAILVCDKSRAQDVKLAVEELKAHGRSELL